MRTLQVSFVFALILAVSVTSFTDLRGSFYMPFVAWSNSAYFTAPETYINNAVDSSFVKSTIDSLTQSTSIEAPQVIIAYLASTLRTDLFREYSLKGQAKHLERFVQTSQTSLVAPFVGASEKSMPLAELLTLAATSNVVFASSSLEQSPWGENKSVLSIEQLKETLSQQRTFESNKQTLFVFVYFDDSQNINEMDSLMSEIDGLVESNVQRYVSMFTGNLPTASQVQKVFFEPHPVALHRLQAIETPLPIVDGNSNSTYPNRWPAGVVQGAINGALLLFFLVFGIVMTSCIQTPDRFEGGQNPLRQH